MQLEYATTCSWLGVCPMQLLQTLSRVPMLHRYDFIESEKKPLATAKPVDYLTYQPITVLLSILSNTYTLTQQRIEDRWVCVCGCMCACARFGHFWWCAFEKLEYLGNGTLALILTLAHVLGKRLGSPWYLVYTKNYASIITLL